jgi:RepB DNA-primase from phage plasmid
MSITPDLDAARRFLQLLDPDAEAFTYQTFDDNPLKRGHLARVCHGSLDEQAQRLIAWSNSGAGVFVMINEGNGMARRAENVIRIRAVFVDLDGSPLQPVMAGPIEPHVVVESSPGRWHCYWIVDGLPLDQFPLVQRAIADRFNGDGSVNDICRVMRLPGFAHRKAEPFLTRVVA